LAGAGHSRQCRRLYQTDRDSTIGATILLFHPQRPHLHSRGCQLAARPWLEGNPIAEAGCCSAPKRCWDRLRHWYGKALEPQPFAPPPGAASDYSRAGGWRAAGPWPACQTGFIPQEDDSQVRRRRWCSRLCLTCAAPSGCVEKVGRCPSGRRKAGCGSANFYAAAPFGDSAPNRGIFLPCALQPLSRGATPKKQATKPSPNGWGRHARTDPEATVLLECPPPLRGFSSGGGAGAFELLDISGGPAQSQRLRGRGCGAFIAAANGHRRL